MILLLLISTILCIVASGCKNSINNDVKICKEKNMVPLLNKNNVTLGWNCLKTFLYHSEDDFCYNAYRQGPCPSEHYYVLPPGENIAKCEKNPCLLDGLVPYQEKCYFLWNSGPACNKSFVNLGINASFQIECGVFEYFGDRENLKRSKSCPEGAHLVPKDSHHTEYVCECEPSFIYSPKNNSCHQAYRQGFCAPGNYVVLPPGETEPRCEENPCQEDGMVRFEGECHKIYAVGPPCDNESQLSVERKTFELQCVGTDEIQSKNIIDAPLKVCPKGHARVLARCKKMFN